MRQIAVMEDGARAKLFGDYLLSRLRIDNRVEANGDVWVVWVYDEANVESARREYQEFQWHPDDEKYRAASVQAESVRREQERDDLRRDENIIKPARGWHMEVRARMGDGSGRFGIGTLTLVLIAVSIAVAVVTKLGESGSVLNSLLIAPVTIEDKFIAWNGLDAIRQGEVWRLITPIFVHFGFMHILFNMWWLKDLGSRIEARKGMLWLALLVLVSGLAGNLAQYYYSGPMSGVVYALFGYVWVKGRLQPSEGLAVSRSTVIIMIGWLFFCMTGWIGPIGDAAHVTGLITGMGLAYAPYRWRRWVRTRAD